MSQRPILLDLFAGAGGAAAGYSHAGFDVVGVDHVAQKRYPYEFHCLDWREGLERFASRADVIHASPPCQRYTRASFTDGNREKHPDLLGQVLAAVEATGLPWVIENVPGAPMTAHSIQLCGLMFGLKVFRHRFFASNLLLLAPAHPGHGKRRIGDDGMCCVVGHGGGVSRRMREYVARRNHDGCGGQQNKAEWEAAMGINWMTCDELSQSIPPAYTEFIGRQLLRALENR